MIPSQTQHTTHQTTDKQYEHLDELMTRPNFLVIGAQKSGTTSLCNLLAAHKDIFLSSPKEPHFFSHDETWIKGWDWYESLFAGAREEAAIGEGGTHNSMAWLYPKAAERIATNLPDARLIYIVRHPLKRIESHWFYWFPNREQRPFNKAVRENQVFVDNSLYWKQINRYRKFFPDHRIRVLFFEDFKRDPMGAINQLFRFLNVDPIEEMTGLQHVHNSSDSIFKDTPSTMTLGKVPYLRGILNYFLTK